MQKWQFWQDGRLTVPSATHVPALHNQIKVSGVRVFVTLFFLSPCLKVGTEIVGIATTLRAGRSGDWIPMGARFSTPVQTGPVAHPDSYTMGTGYFPGLKRPGRGDDHPPHLQQRLKKGQSYTSTPPMGLRGLFRMNFTRTFTFLNN